MPLRYHIGAIDPTFVNQFNQSIRVDVILGAEDLESACKLYQKSRQQLREGGFTVRKSVTNSTTELAPEFRLQKQV